MHKDDCIWTEPNRCNCGWLQDIAKNPCEAVREIERLRAELAESKYAEHDAECQGQPGYDIPCSCGYDELMKELEESK